MTTIYFLCNSKLHIFKLIILFLSYLNFRWMKKRIHGMLKIFKIFPFWIVPSVILKLRQKTYSKIMQLKIIPNQGCKTFQYRTFSLWTFEPLIFEPWKCQPWTFSTTNSPTLEFSTTDLFQPPCVEKFGPQGIQLRNFQPLYVWKVHGWKVHGWKVHGWKVRGWKVHGWKVHGWKVLD